MGMEVMGDRLYRNGEPVPFKQSPNTGGRITPEVICLHDTADWPEVIRDTVNWFLNRKSKVSAHLVIGRDADMMQMADFDRRTNHAGRSSYAGRSHVNNFSIGIEIDNPGALQGTEKRASAWFSKGNKGFYGPAEGVKRVSTPYHGNHVWMPYTEAQIEAVIECCRALVRRYPTIKAITTHYEVSPGRKVDTNPLFPLERVRKAVFEDWPEPAKTRFLLAFGSRGSEVETLQTRLTALGYKPGVADGIFGSRTRAAVLTWEAEQGRVTDGEIDQEDFTSLTAEDAKSMPETPAATASMEAKQSAGRKVDVATVTSSFLLGVGVIAENALGGVWSGLLSGLDRMSTLVSKLAGLGLKVPPDVIVSCLSALLIYTLWKWSRQSRPDNGGTE
ncbi:MAG: N-acetylmuramoyl-L-alanine amidase [Filomicrobium sp.]